MTTSDSSSRFGGLVTGGAIVAAALAVRIAVGIGDAAAPTLHTANILLIAVLASAASVPLVMIAAGKFGAVDHPDQARKIHLRPTPRWGGISIYVGITIAMVLESSAYMPNLRPLLLGTTAVFVAGLLDDAVPTPALFRLGVQILACVVLITNGIHVTFLPDTWWGVTGEWLITLLWIVGITNAINFLDGMDGLVSGLAATIGLVFFSLAVLLRAPMLAYCATAVVGACLGFIGFNVRPARIFLGDSGSNLLGFLLAALGIMGDWAENAPLVSFLVPVMALSVPIYDMIFITCSRIADGRVRSLRTWLEYTGRDHLHHRLENLGLSRGQVVLTICFLNLGVGLGAVAMLQVQTLGGLALVSQAICIYSIVALLEILGKKRHHLPVVSTSR